MPVPPGFNNKVIICEPVTAADLNAVIATQNAAGNWLTDIKIMDATGAALLFCVNYNAAYGYTALQRVNLVLFMQANLDADAAAQLIDGYVPTGMFLDPTTPGAVYVLYQLLVDSPA